MSGKRVKAQRRAAYRTKLGHVAQLAQAFAPDDTDKQLAIAVEMMGMTDEQLAESVIDAARIAQWSVLRRMQGGASWK